jgi:hypothetical protein
MQGVWAGGKRVSRVQTPAFVESWRRAGVLSDSGETGGTRRPADRYPRLVVPERNSSTSECRTASCSWTTAGGVRFLSPSRARRRSSPSLKPGVPAATAQTLQYAARYDPAELRGERPKLDLSNAR